MKVKDSKNNGGSKKKSEIHAIIKQVTHWNGGRGVGGECTEFEDGIQIHINTEFRIIPDQVLAYLTYWDTSARNRK